MAKTYKVTMMDKRKKKLVLSACLVTTESKAQAERIAKRNYPELTVVETKLSGH